MMVVVAMMMRRMENGEWRMEGIIKRESADSKILTNKQ
jgi:hypothetical protein